MSTERSTISYISKRKVEGKELNSTCTGTGKRSMSIDNIESNEILKSRDFNNAILRKISGIRQSAGTSNTFGRSEKLLSTSVSNGVSGSGGRTKANGVSEVGMNKTSSSTRSYSHTNLKTVESLKSKNKTLTGKEKESTTKPALSTSKLSLNSLCSDRTEGRICKKLSEKEERRYNYCQLCKGSESIKEERIPDGNVSSASKERTTSCSSNSNTVTSCNYNTESKVKIEESERSNSVEFHRKIFSTRKNVSLDDFHTVAIIGQGGYSIVRLVFDLYTGYEYALKQAKKSQIITRMISSSLSETENLSEIGINYSKTGTFIGKGAGVVGNISNMSSGLTNSENKGFSGSQCLTGKNESSLNTGMMLNTEISLMYSSDSPWINKLYYYWEDSHFYYMLMEYMPGGDLMRHLMELHIFEEKIAKFYIAELLLALEYLNNTREYIHRDIKPDNILLDSNGHIKLIDFGLSKQIRSNEKQLPFVSNVVQNINIKTTENINYLSNHNKNDGINGAEIHNILIHDPNFHAGTPDYMAPEIHRGEAYTLSVDLWSVGIILYEMLFGGPPLSDPGQNSLITRNKVMNWEKHFYLPSEHHKYSHEAIDLICCLISEPNQRMKTVKDVMKHPFFKDINFKNLRQQKPPIVPTVKHKLDHSNFDKFSIQVLINFYNSVNAVPNIPIPCIADDIHFSLSQINKACVVNKNNALEANGADIGIIGNNYIKNPGICNSTNGSNNDTHNDCSGGKPFNSHNILDVSPKLNCSNKLFNSICTPKRSYLPSLFSPSSNSTSASSWKYHINNYNSPLLHTHRNPSPIPTYVNSNNHGNGNIIINPPTPNKSLSNFNTKGLNNNHNNINGSNSYLPESLCNGLKSPNIFVSNTKSNSKSNENTVYKANCYSNISRSNINSENVSAKQKLSILANSTISRNNQNIIKLLKKGVV
ncbi:S T kinase [Cryptosporidium bovis]|uniref:S T kinase n=1 Tax=Cryptosporidium bovis TaxID=310047 RepID=UPI00351A5A9A|nr:S T kinase [Cryptosporidium bovis]